MLAAIPGLFRQRLSALLFALLVALPAAASPPMVVANWNDYINPDLLARFTAETGIQVDYRTYETDTDVDALLRQDFPPDVLVPDIHYLPALIREGLLQPLDLRSLPAYEDLDPLILSRLSSADPWRRYAMPYHWGRVGIVLDRSRVEQALGGPAGRSWSLLFDPARLQQLASCGASLLDARAEFFTLWMNWRGALAERATSRDIRAFQQALVELRPHLRAVDNLGYLEDLPAGRQCIAMAWEGDARSLVSANAHLEFFIPDEGSTLYIDAMVVPAKARMASEAWRFIEFMTRPEIAYLNAAYIQYNSPYKTVICYLVQTRGEEAAWRHLQLGAGGNTVSLMLSPGSQRREVADAWTAFAGAPGEGLAVGARN